MDGSGAGDVRLTVFGPDGSEIASAAGALGLHVVVPDPQRWWPRGCGDQPLYRAMLTAGDVALADRKFGFRTVSVDQSGGAWQLAVNDVPVFCRGAAWTPPDPVRLTVPEDVLRQHLSQLAQRGANMVRVVGGMVYEQPAFYDCCAELGLLVWQDAMLATFDPPRELNDVIAREVATLLDAHSGNPALAVLSGGSETLQRPEMLGIRAEDRGVPVIDQVLRDVVGVHADVVYVRSSPAPPDGSEHLSIRPDSVVAQWFGVGVLGVLGGHAGARAGDGAAMTLHAPRGFRIRVGCDVTPVSDIAVSVERFGDQYLTRVFASSPIAPVWTDCRAWRPGSPPRRRCSRLSLSLIWPWRPRRSWWCASPGCPSWPRGRAGTRAR